MKVTVVSKPLDQVAADVLVVLHEESGPLAQTASSGLSAHIDAFAKAVQKKQSRREWFCTLEKEAGCKAKHLLLDSTTFAANSPHDEPLKVAAARTVALCRDHGQKSIAFAAHHTLSARKAAAILEGVILGDFQDARFKGALAGDSERGELSITLVVNKEAEKEAKALCGDVQVICESANAARELTNAPNDVLTPAAMADYARALSKKYNFKCTILDEKKLQAQGYMPTWEVGRGSEFPPRMMVMKYTPKKKAVREHIALVGKGMTFDTGGLCIKPRETMHLMNCDMGGAAAVLGAMEAIARLELPVQVTAIIASAHNAVDGAAYHPGSIMKAKNGKTIYIENTDAEGRLILSDCFHRAGEEGAEIMWDFATLTGAVVMSLGPTIAGLFTEDDELRSILLESANNTGDGLWPLPIVKEYDTFLRHNLADLCNISVSEKNGGAIHAANFLKHFVPDGMRWAHIDIAGPAHIKGNFRYFRPGGTGYGVRLAVEALRLMVARGK